MIIEVSIYEVGIGWWKLESFLMRYFWVVFNILFLNKDMLD